MKNYVGSGAWLIMEKQKGSLFAIRSPDGSGKQSAPRRESRDPMSSEGPTRPCVLVVEDDVETQRFMGVLLGKRYDVLLASSGDELRRLLESDGGRVRLVLMDLSLKGAEDGLELTRALRQQERWKSLPIVAVTAHAFPSDRANALNAGCNAYVEKPIDIVRLLGLVERFVTRG
jgi:CheY-like chemotaxis protein